jgi:predicted small secreted protein
VDGLPDFLQPMRQSMNWIKYLIAVLLLAFLLVGCNFDTQVGKVSGARVDINDSIGTGLLITPSTE